MRGKMKGNSIGISLILVVFILLCLITFGTLSYMLAESDNEMSISSAENIVEYYNGDMTAQEMLKEVDEVLADTYWMSGDEASYISNLEAAFEDYGAVEVVAGEDGNFVVFTTVISDTEILRSELEICYPATEGYYRVESWTLEYTSGL